ncbi:Retrovirus-related Pol polyprotein from transposon RE1 [Vitis vinifera]|uniref:Retrovirus-related Pol polyprotein from transposon RE1 n=1 Tax=Vitis vinifera TaxID=29760 RepID=A0A438IZQ9_VITVI|nr:Retrovirus-related Pol polyprotein from transposon RE1 [Vitis vinifera]
MAKSRSSSSRWIIGTLSEETLGLAVGLDTANDVWEALKNAYAEDSQEREFTLRQQVTYLWKEDDKTIGEHIRTFKSLCDSLAAIGKPVPDKEKVFCLLTSLGPQYETFTTTMLKPPRPSYFKLVSQLQSLDQRRNWFSNHANAAHATPQMAFYEQQQQRYPQFSIGYQGNKQKFTSTGRGFQAQQSKDQNCGYLSSPTSSTQQRRPPPPGERRMTPVERDLYREEKCQYCGMVGHIAKICWWVPKRPTQQDDIPQALAALTLDNTIAKMEWTSDTGASNHMTGKQGMLTNIRNYSGSDSILIGDGSSLPILGIGDSSIKQKNKERQTGHPMITGRRKGDLYVLPNSPELYFSHRFKSGLADIWHQPFEQYVNIQFNKKIKVFHSDGGGEFINFKLSSHFLSTGIIHQVSCPYTPEQTEVFSTAVYLINRLPSSTLNSETPYFALHGTHPDYTSLHVFGSSTNATSQPETTVLPSLQVELYEQSFNTLPNAIEPNQLGLQSPTHQKQPPQPQPAPSMITRSQRGIIKPNPKYALTSTTNSTNIPREPHNIRAALAHPGWKAGMDEELQALHTNKTWVLVPRTSDMHVIGSKWVFKPKLKPDGSLDCLKARVVAKGYHQVDGLDYTETFSPVIKPGTIRMVLTIALVKKWPIRQLDVKNAFLHSLISKDIHMEQPPGMADLEHPTHVCKLQKALYGLKQAPRACSEFAMKDLGQIHYFLGIEISQTADGLHLSQSHYAFTILERANMVDCKPMSTPLEAKTKTSPNNVLLEDPSYFRGLVGALQYLTLMRPDLSYSVNYASQFMHAPTLVHLKMIGRGVQPHDDPSLATVRFLEEISSPAAELTWMSFILNDLHIPLASTPTLYCDNTSALHMTINPVFHARSKHIELDYHFVRERVALGLLVTQHISIEKQVADLFTKPMSKAALSNFQTKLCLQPRHNLREGIGTTQQHLGVNCGTQRSDKVEYNYGSDKAENSHNSCYNSGETLKDEEVSMATTSTRNGSLTS